MYDSAASATNRMHNLAHKERYGQWATKATPRPALKQYVEPVKNWWNDPQDWRNQ